MNALRHWLSFDCIYFFYIGVADHYSLFNIHYSIAKRYGLRVYILPCASLPAPVPLYLLFAVLKR